MPQEPKRKEPQDKTREENNTGHETFEKGKTTSEKETTTTRLPKGIIITSEGNHNHKSKKATTCMSQDLEIFFI